MKVLKSWGTDGKVVLSLSSDDPGDFTLDEPVFIEFDGLPVPFFIESAEPKGNRLVVKFEDVDTAQAAGELVGREVNPSAGTDDSEEDSLTGMTVRDTKGNTIGPIVQFNDFAGNTCVTVDYGGQEILLPFHEDLIRKVRKDTITLEIPEGLLDAYLQK